MPCAAAKATRLALAGLLPISLQKMVQHSLHRLRLHVVPSSKLDPAHGSQHSPASLFGRHISAAGAMQRPCTATREVSIPGQRQHSSAAQPAPALSSPRTRTRHEPAADPTDGRDEPCCFGLMDPAARLHALSHVSSAPVSRAVLCMRHPQLTCKLLIRLMKHVKLPRDM